MSIPLRSLLVAASVCALATTASARDMYYSYAESPAENVYLSQHYDYLLETNIAFRHYRMRKECNPIDDMALNQDCLASFDTYEPWRGYR